MAKVPRCGEHGVNEIDAATLAKVKAAIRPA